MSAEQSQTTGPRCPAWVALTAVILGALPVAAHAWRWQGPLAALAWMTPFGLLALRRPFARLAAGAALAAGCLLLAHTGAQLAGARLAMGLPFARLAAIMTLAALLPLVGAAALAHPVFGAGRRGEDGLRPGADPKRENATAGAIPSTRTWSTGAVQSDRTWSARADLGQNPSRPGAPGLTGFAAWVLTWGLLLAARERGPWGLLLADRFLAGGGVLQVALLALYAGLLAEGLADPARSPRVRRLAWTGFSLIFFAQLALGLAGVPGLLLTGQTHLPVPALILAGPLFRGEGFFMPVLFGVSALVLGPAWCSHLCYVGAWDGVCAAKAGSPAPAPRFLAWARAGLAVLVMAVAVGLRLAGATPLVAGALAAGFGLTGVGAALLVSRRRGYMAHCAGFCPMGLAAGLLGRLSPWRLRVAADCTGCGACARTCRYNALRPEHLAGGRAGLSCSLCLDCLGRCGRGSLALSAFGRVAPRVRPVFAVLAASLMATFLGVARM